MTELMMVVLDCTIRPETGELLIYEIQDAHGSSYNPADITSATGIDRSFNQLLKYTYPEQDYVYFGLNRNMTIASRPLNRNLPGEKSLVWIEQAHRQANLPEEFTSRIKHSENMRTLEFLRNKFLQRLFLNQAELKQYSPQCKAFFHQQYSELAFIATDLDCFFNQETSNKHFVLKNVDATLGLGNHFMVAETAISLYQQIKLYLDNQINLALYLLETCHNFSIPSKTPCIYRLYAGLHFRKSDLESLVVKHLCTYALAANHYDSHQCNKQFVIPSDMCFDFENKQQRAITVDEQRVYKLSDAGIKKLEAHCQKLFSPLAGFMDRIKSAPGTTPVTHAMFNSIAINDQMAKKLFSNFSNPDKLNMITRGDTLDYIQTAKTFRDLVTRNNGYRLIAKLQSFITVLLQMENNTSKQFKEDLRALSTEIQIESNVTVHQHPIGPSKKGDNTEIKARCYYYLYRLLLIIRDNDATLSHFISILNTSKFVAARQLRKYLWNFIDEQKRYFVIGMQDSLKYLTIFEIPYRWLQGILQGTGIDSSKVHSQNVMRYYKLAIEFVFTDISIPKASKQNESLMLCKFLLYTAVESMLTLQQQLAIQDEISPLTNSAMRITIAKKIGKQGVYQQYPILSTCENQACQTFADKRCSRCKDVYYCSPECQKAHWLTHKPNCKKVA